MVRVEDTYIMQASEQIRWIAAFKFVAVDVSVRVCFAPLLPRCFVLSNTQLHRVAHVNKAAHFNWILSLLIGDCVALVAITNYR